MLNNLSDMADIWYLKRRYMHMMIKMIQVKYGPEATSTNRNHKHTRIESSTTRRWFNCSLSQQLIHLLLNNGMMSGSHLDIKMPEVAWNKGGWDQSWRWWPQTILSTNLLDVMLLHWSKNLKSIPTWKTAKMKMMRSLRTMTHQKCWPPHDPFPPSDC